MILTLSEAQNINKTITQLELDAYENTIRELTNNKFHHGFIKNSNLAFTHDSIISSEELVGYRVGDTVEIINTKFNNGLWLIEKVVDDYILKIVTDDKQMTESTGETAVVFKIEYPADIKIGLLEVIKYKTKMANKIGIKSERISRTSVTYHDVSATDNTEGIPSSYWSFLDKYRKLRW